MESLLTVTILFILFLGFFFWKYPQMMKDLFSFKKVERPDKPPAPSTSVERMPQYGHTGYEDVGFINEPLQPPVVKVPRHEIIKHDYYNAYGNERWPRWTCRCGGSGYAITTVYESLEATEKEARRDGQDHVRKATIIDDRLKKTDGNFAF